MESKMSQQLQELIDKIKQEGVQAAEQKAREIEAEAQKKAEVLISQAQGQASQLIDQAHKECQKLTQTTRTALKQASRDTLLELKTQIQRILERLVLTQVTASLAPEVLAHILEGLIKKSLEHKIGPENINIVLSPADLEKLKKGFIAKLHQELKKPIEFRSSDDIKGGFTISFDGGKSSFDFSDASLAEYLSGALSPEIASFLKEAGE